MTRVGIRTFWAPVDAVVPRVLVVEVVPVIGLLLLTLGLAITGGPVMRYMDATARAVHAPSSYIERVLTAPRVPAAKSRPMSRAAALSAPDGVAAGDVAAAERPVARTVPARRRDRHRGVRRDGRAAAGQAAAAGAGSCCPSSR